jgi:hypothetical protein
MAELIAGTSALPIKSTDQAIQVVEGSLLPDGIDNVILKVWGPIAPGTEVRGTKELVFIAPSEGFAIYIDDYPTANLFHPVRYAFVHAATGQVTVTDATSPPLNFQDYKTIETAVWNILQSAENRRPPLTDVPTPVGRSNRWAVLMNGGYDSGSNHVRYWNDLSNRTGSIPPPINPTARIPTRTSTVTGTMTSCIPVF